MNRVKGYVNDQGAMTGKILVINVEFSLPSQSIRESFTYRVESLVEFKKRSTFRQIFDEELSINFGLTLENTHGTK